MSWLNFNESLNTIKGQLSNLASGVLNEGIVNNAEDEHSRNDGDNTEGTLQFGAIPIQQSTGDSIKAADTTWTWHPQPSAEDDVHHHRPTSTTTTTNTTAPLVKDLEQQIELLRTEKKDLLLSLEQLDFDCQQTTDKLVTLKDSLQTDYNALKTDFEKLQMEYGEVLTENMEKTKRIEALQRTSTSSESEHLQTENRMLNKQLMVSLKEIETHQDLISKYEQLQKDYEHLERITVDDDLIREHEELALRNSNLSIERDTLEARKADLEKQVEDLMEENMRLKEARLDQSAHQEVIREKEALHQQYINIITEYMKKYTDPTSPTTSPSITTPISCAHNPELAEEFAGKVETLLKLLLDFKNKTELLEKELCQVSQEKNATVSEKNFEIEKLLKNSEILSQEVITKSQTIKEYEDECAELMKNNDVLITELQNYKNTSGLQTISESNEDNLLLLESQLETANKRIQDLETIITELEASKQESNLELDYIKKQLNLTGQELNQSKEEHHHLLLRHQKLEEDRNGLKATLEKTKTDYENTEYKYTEINVNMETLKEENEDHKVENANLTNKIELLQSITDEYKQKLDLELEKNQQNELQTRNLIEKLQNSKMAETSLKLQVDTIYKELQVVSEAKQNLERRLEELEKKTTQESSNKDLEEAVKSKSDLEETKRDLEKTKKDLEESREDLEKTKKNLEEAVRSKFDLGETNKALEEVVRLKSDLEVSNKALEAALKSKTDLEASRNELIALITAKHQENVQYHNEIQRLTSLVHNLEISAGKHEELEKLTDQNNFLREKCEVLAANLLQEQTNTQKVLLEHQQAASEKEQTLSRELDRLRAHLVEIEDAYTQELLQAEQKNKEMLMKVNEIERREKDSTSIYTSVSIRANQQVETLQTQLQLVTNQRDDLRTRISDLEDDNNKQAAALTNLQLVLEQFQRDKEKSVMQETERIRRQIGTEKQIQRELQKEIDALKVQLDESKQGLQAASRLSDQLEKSRQQVAALKTEVSKLQEQLSSNEKRYKDITSQNESKIDKLLIKNLIVGYITSNTNNDQNQILKIIATVLDFNQKESERVNLNKPQQGGWLNSILHPQSVLNNQDSGGNQLSLSEAFVRFLENESKPKVLPNLLDSQGAKSVVVTGTTASSSKSTTPGQNSPLVLNEVVLPTFVDFGKNRNSSSILKDALNDNS